VSDIAWQEQPTLYGALASDSSYTLETDEQGRVFIVFGDGERGARLPSGLNNVRALYRTGLGKQGNVASDQLTQLVTRPLGLKSVSNPLAAQGGTDPEDIEGARRSIPLTTRTLDRAVSLLDYEDFARGFAGVAKAQAAVLQLPHGPTVAITIAGAGGAAASPASPVWKNLLSALRANGDPHVQVQLLSADLKSFRLGLRVKCDPRYETPQVLANVETALRERYGFDARELSAPVQESELISIVQRVAGVLAVDLTALHRDGQLVSQPFASGRGRLLAARTRVQAGAAMAGELLTLHTDPFDLLEAMS
jgi:predicted phage baseplate assembly protein